MGQFGIAKKFVVVVVCLVLAGAYFLGYRSVHTIALNNAHKKTVAAQTAKINKAKNLETQLESAWKQTLTTTPPDGNVDVAVYDNATGAIAEYTNAPSGTTYNTASIIKLSILETLLLQNQKNGISGLTSSQLAQATPMIENSDNDAATDLWDTIGEAPAINSFYQQIGTTNSKAGDDWGLTQTTALDQLKVVGQIAYPKLLSSASVQQANSLMNNVESDQRWGVSGGVPTGVSVQLKNGWLEGDGTDFSGWEVNSIGYVHGNGVDYTIAVLTSGGRTEQDGINTIQSLSTDAWNTISATKS